MQVKHLHHRGCVRDGEGAIFKNRKHANIGGQAHNQKHPALRPGRSFDENARSIIDRDGEKQNHARLMTLMPDLKNALKYYQLCYNFNLNHNFTI